MKKLTKDMIEKMAQEVIRVCDRLDGGSCCVIVYWNEKRSLYNRKEHKYNQRIIEESINPHDYFGCAYDHILSMSFDGSVVYGYYNNHGECRELDRVFEKYGCYAEFNDAWNLSLYPINDMEVEYTVYERPKKTINLYRPDYPICDWIKPIMEEWYKRSADYGDVGSCVIGAGFTFEKDGQPYHLSPQSPYQGSCSWESSIDWVRDELEKIGCTNIGWNYGRLD